MRELGFEDGVDTLGRWMAHHLAELIEAAERATTPAERLKALKGATETILNVWEHRELLPRKAHPLAPYKDALRVLERLRPDNNPFGHLAAGLEAKREHLAATLFDGLSRLIIALLLMSVPSSERSAEVSAPAIEALSDSEQRVLISLQEWGDLFTSTSQNSSRSRKNRTSKTGSATTNVNLDEAARRLIDGMMSTLVELRSELQKEGEPPTKN